MKRLLVSAWRRIWTSLKANRGEGFPLIIAVTLALLLVFCGISEYFRMMIIAQGVRDAVQQSVISAVNDNYDDVYHGAREGYSGGYVPVDETFEESLDYGNIYGQMAALLGLTGNSEQLVSYNADGSMEYRISGLDVEVSNLPLAGGQPSSERFEAVCTIVLEVPVSFAGRILPPMRMVLRVMAGYVPKF